MLDVHDLGVQSPALVGVRLAVSLSWDFPRATAHMVVVAGSRAGQSMADHGESRERVQAPVRVHSDALSCCAVVGYRGHICGALTMLSAGRKNEAKQVKTYVRSHPGMMDDTRERRLVTEGWPSQKPLRTTGKPTDGDLGDCPDLTLEAGVEPEVRSGSSPHL
jgi:hypothetical protein